LQKYLKDKGIPSMIYYPVALHAQDAYKSYGFKHEDFPITNKLCESVLSLPIHSELPIEQQEYITENLLNFLNK